MNRVPDHAGGTQIKGGSVMGGLEPEAVGNDALALAGRALREVAT